MTSLKDYIIRHGHTRRPSRTSSHPMREGTGDASVMRSLGLDTASVAIPAGIDLDDRATRMNEFWRLVEFQYRDVLVVALCAGEER